MQDKTIDKLLKAPAFTVQRKSDKKKEKHSHWNAFNLIPTIEELYSLSEEYEYKIKMLCWLVSDNDSMTFIKLYEERSLLDVYELLMMKKALDYELHN